MDEVNARVRTTSAVTAVLFSTQIQSVAAFTNSYATRPLLVAALADGDPANFDHAVIEAQLAELAPPGNGGAFLATPACQVTNVRPFTPEVIGGDFSARDWCRGVTSTRAPYVSEAFRAAIVGQPLAVAIAVPVRAIGADRTSPVVAILGVVYPLDTIADFADGLAHAQGLHLIVTDQRGTLMAGTGIHAPAVDGLVSVASDPRVREALAGRSGLTRSIEVDGDALSGYAPVPGTGWTVTAEVNAHDALASVRHLRATVLAVAAILGLVMMIGVVLLARALRQRRDVDRTLTEREASTRAILEAATDAFIAMDASGKIIAWNRQAEVMFGWTEAEALGRRRVRHHLAAGDAGGPLTDGLAEFVATGGGFARSSGNDRFEAPAIHRDGHRFVVELGIWAVQTGATRGSSTPSCRTSPSARWPRPPWRRPGTRRWPPRSSSRSSWPT